MKAYKTKEKKIKLENGRNIFIFFLKLTTDFSREALVTNAKFGSFSAKVATTTIA
jgi:hypothetical protein